MDTSYYALDPECGRMVSACTFGKGAMRSRADPDHRQLVTQS